MTSLNETNVHCYLSMKYLRNWWHIHLPWHRRKLNTYIVLILLCAIVNSALPCFHLLWSRSARSKSGNKFCLIDSSSKTFWRVTYLSDVWCVTSCNVWDVTSSDVWDMTSSDVWGVTSYDVWGVTHSSDVWDVTSSNVIGVTSHDVWGVTHSSDVWLLSIDVDDFDSKARTCDDKNDSILCHYEMRKNVDG